MLRVILLSLCLAAVSAAPAMAPSSATDPATTVWPKDGKGAAVNCTFGTMADSWLEMTNMMNYTQYTSTDEDDPNDVPSTEEMQADGYALSATDTRAPAFVGACQASSPSAPQPCTYGVDCDVYIEEWGLQWMEFAILECMGSYPVPNVATFSSPIPPPGNVSFTMTQQCKNYNYPAGVWSMEVTDTFGAKYALQTSQSAMPDDAAWATNLDSVVWPPGWTMENVTATTNATHTPYITQDGECWMLIIKDSNANAWHQFIYPGKGEPKMVDFSPCTNFVQGSPNGPAPALAPTSETPDSGTPDAPTPAAPGGGAATKSVVAAAMVLAAAMVI